MFAKRAIAAAALLMIAGCGQPGARDQIRIVGSSTVYPFTTAVAEWFVRTNPRFKSPVVEQTGTGAGMSLFCRGIGAQHPDVENASRRIKKSEYEECARNGVKDIVEIQVGIDGIAFAESVRGPRFELTLTDIYKAVAATPYGKPNTATRWNQVNPSFPDIPIQVYGPPSTSGTRDALTELIMAKACDADPAIKALKERDADRHKAICTKVREDGAYINTGENDNLIVQKLGANPNALGIFGYSFLEENMDRLRGIPLDGIQPTYESISSFRYPGARPLYIYVKSAHLRAIPGLREFVAEYANGWNPGGYLMRRGMILSPDPIRMQSAKIAAAFTPLDPKGLK
ncbi:PstS family phosphate ABC transporter substrate-binding protein [Sphingomonas sanxanigenens]|uniref:PBP domain-containing protein n=1 Tax=Sphingomonas sanxanigenens DSM 19645 = NX02 TaxID=1123269 RepID=W0A7A6_9SPHN|nr:hypothetical protein NX02_10535 [Sphingomonas sanxanigenens DSM 19645 = NX02]